MYVVAYSRRFEKSLLRLVRSQRVSREEVDFVISELKAGRNLIQKYKDHSLKGSLLGVRECHIRNDILLMYEIDGDNLIIHIVDIGSHAELFG